MYTSLLFTPKVTRIQRSCWQILTVHQAHRPYTVRENLSSTSRPFMDELRYPLALAQMAAYVEELPPPRDKQTSPKNDRMNSTPDDAPGRESICRRIIKSHAYSQPTSINIPNRLVIVTNSDSQNLIHLPTMVHPQFQH